MRQGKLNSAPKGMNVTEMSDRADTACVKKDFPQQEQIANYDLALYRPSVDTATRPPQRYLRPNALDATGFQ